MPRAKYTITEADASHAQAYLEGQIRSYSLQLNDPSAARRSFERAIALESKEARAVGLNTWAEKYLDSGDWKKLKSAILKRRARRKNGDCTTQLTLSNKAHKLLVRLARRDNVTLSEAVESHVPKILNRAARRK